jgi:Uma2 family endonuclease
MIATFTRSRTIPTAAVLFRRLGDVPLDRVRMVPAPGAATEADLIKYCDEDDRLYELVHGTLVEKAMGIGEAKLEAWITFLLGKFVFEHSIGELVSGSGLMRLKAGQVRSPSISFFCWERATTEEEDAADLIADVAPDLAVEVIRRSNTPREMAQKRREYFGAGTSLVWQVYPTAKTVEVYRALTRPRVLTIDDTLDGGTVLPGLAIPLKRLFGRPTKPGKRKKG